MIVNIMDQINFIKRLEDITKSKLPQEEVAKFLKLGRNSKVENLMKSALEDTNASNGIELISPLIQKIITKKIIDDYNNTNKPLLSFLQDDLILNFLKAGLITNLFLENFFQKVRSAITEKYAKNSVINPDHYKQSMPCLKGIASQCFSNEYIWDISEVDKNNVRIILDKSEDIIEKKGKIPNPFILILSSFQSLNKYPNLSNYINLTAPHYQEINDVIKKQLLDFNEELKIRETIKNLTKVEDLTSKEVKKQYEENPYPRWLSIPEPLKNKTYGNSINDSLFKKISKEKIGTLSNVLIAGCGTGRHPIFIAALDKDIEITAIDITKASLSYGKRMAKNLNIKNINWLQADILKLDDIDKKYDVIESVGVIHHMKDPNKGFELLDRRLKKNGLLKLGLYARYFRKGRLDTIKKYISENRLPPTIESIRDVRKYVLNNLKNKDLSPLATIPDYYNTSGFRDLLMHVQEWDYTIPEIKKMIKDKYDFIGFTLPSNKFEEYKKKFPGDRFLNNLNNWNIFEKENPDFFEGMYQFWLQKKMNIK